MKAMRFFFALLLAVPLARMASAQTVLPIITNLVAWGRNDYGQTNIPASVANVISIGAGQYNSVVAKADGTVVAR